MELLIFNGTFEKISFTVFAGEKTKRTTTPLTNPLESPLKFLRYKGEKFFLLIVSKHFWMSTERGLSGFTEQN